MKCLGQLSLADSLNQQAYQEYRKDVSKGKNLAYRALSIAEALKADEQIVDSYVNLSRCFRVETNWDSAYWVLNQAIERGKKANYPLGLMNATNNLAICYLTQGEMDQATPFLKESLQYAQRINNAKGQANAYNNLAIIAEGRESYDSAVFYLHGALAVYRDIKDSAGISRTYLNQAFIFDTQNQHDSAIYYNIQALRIQEANELVSQQANTHILIGGSYYEKDDEPQALEQYKKARDLFEQIGDISGQFLAYSNIGAVLSHMKRDEEARPILEKALRLARQTEDPYSIGSSLINLADLYVEQKEQLELVPDMYREAIPLLEEIESYSLALAYTGFGGYFEVVGQSNQAIQWYQKGLETGKEYENLVSQREALRALSNINERKGNIGQALTFLQEYHDINDSILNLESIEAINQLNIEYESEKKEKENLILQNDLTTAELANAEQKALRNQILALGSLIIFLGLAGFIWYRYRQRIRLKEQEMELEQERARQEQRRKEAEKLRELDAMKTRFFTNISHEFRTPLTLIIGKNEQMQANTADPKLKNGFEMVGRNGHRLLDLVNQVLDVAKLEAGGMELNLARLDAIPFLKHMLYSFESMGQEKGISLAFESELQELDTAFDHKKIERVIFNLLSNAMKFTPAGGVIRMMVKQTGKDLQIAVSDSGVGIKASQLPNIFDRFYQADSSENQPQPGTGIGLSLVKELVELHQGEISVESELNKGTTFIFSLPIPADPSQYAQQDVAPQLSIESLPSKHIAAESNGTATAQKAEKILLVEDNHDVRAFVKEQILSFGYQVHEAVDGVEGLEKAQELIPDLIISDIMMPRLDGYGVAKGLKEDMRTSHIPVVLLTSKASDDSKIAGLELGVDDYLLKPFNAKELEIRIGNLIEQRKRLRERFSSATVIRPNEVSTQSMDQVFLKKVLDTIEENIGEERFGVETLADHAGMSVNNLNLKLKALIDQTAGKLLRSMRLQRACDLLKQKAGTIAEIAYDTGFNSQSNFTRSFKQQFGVSPTVWQKEHAA
ncbi:MAG: tetratricopeptide repeat protein [Bacteroidota bacterium]